jgi:pimeloyl-ACP methyl ester carboxylesterase
MHPASRPKIEDHLRRHQATTGRRDPRRRSFMLDRVEAANGLTEICGVRIELVRRGAGRPLLLLHPSIGLKPTERILDLLAEHFALLAPSHPGFGRSELPPSMTTVDDLAYFYLDVMDALDLRDVILAGISFGGWIAVEMAVKSTERISHLVLADAVGIKVGDREHRDIADIFTIKQNDLDRLAYHDPRLAAVDHRSISEEDANIMFRNRETTALFAWSPYMYDPKLAGRLHRIRVPTLFLWGASDRIASTDYGRAYSRLIAGAEFALIDQAGHYPHVERPELFARKILDFVDREP